MHVSPGITHALAARTIDRVESHLHLGADSNVDDRNVIITPMQPERTDPFVLLAEDWFSSSGFDWHPHRGLETVTFVLDGVLEHGDNVGNLGTLEPGDVQWMTAGRGIIHREHAFRNEHTHLLQLWVNLPAERKFVEPTYQDLLAAKRPVVELEGLRVDVISAAAAGITATAGNQWPITAAMLTFEPDRRYDHVIPAHDRAFVYVLRGEATVAMRRVTAGQIA
jgi:quercetin 2,3-dioxygenase